MIQTQVNAFQNPQLFFVLHTYRDVLMSKLWIGIIQKYNKKKWLKSGFYEPHFCETSPATKSDRDKWWLSPQAFIDGVSCLLAVYQLNWVGDT